MARNCGFCCTVSKAWARWFASWRLDMALRHDLRRGRPFTKRSGRVIDPPVTGFEVTIRPSNIAHVARAGHAWSVVCSVCAAAVNGHAALIFCHIGCVRQAITFYGRAAQPRPRILFEKFCCMR